MKDECQKFLVLVCVHIRQGAAMAHVVPPWETEDGWGEVMCAACAENPPDDPAGYEWACLDCLTRLSRERAKVN